jgi:outer membrane biogenesis lipoprotein LolB
LKVRFFAAAYLLVFLTSCASIPADDEKATWRMSGKLSVRAAGQSQVMNIEWLQQGERSAIELFGPFRLKLAKIVADGDEITVRTRQGEFHYSEDSRLDLTENIEIQLPWQAMAHWVRGKNDVDAEEIGEGGYQFGNWFVQVPERDNEGPKLVTLNYPDIDVKLKIVSWIFN